MSKQPATIWGYHGHFGVKSAPLWLFLTVATHVALAQTEIASQSPRDFLANLMGTWHGKAVQTPIGPVLYDVGFVKQANNCVSGVAIMRLSEHTWTFCEQDQQLRLRFLTNFGGNATPVHFVQTSEVGGVRTFNAESHPFMHLLVSIQRDNGWIKVMHYGQLHVKIQLSR